MSWFDRRKQEVSNEETGKEDMKPKETGFSFQRFQDKSPEEQQESLKSQKDFADERKNFKAPPKPAEDDAYKEEREREL